MTTKKKILIGIATALILPVLVMSIYLIVKYEPDLAAGWEAGDPSAAVRLLVASSGSAFKKGLIGEVVQRLAGQGVRISIVPLAALSTNNPAAFKAIMILNSCEMSRLDGSVTAFLEKNSDHRSVVLVTTSGESDWKSERFPIDGISGASKPEYGTRIVSEAVARLQVLLR